MSRDTLNFDGSWNSFSLLPKMLFQHPLGNSSSLSQMSYGCNFQMGCRFGSHSQPVSKACFFPSFVAKKEIIFGAVPNFRKETSFTKTFLWYFIFLALNSPLWTHHLELCGDKFLRNKHSLFVVQRLTPQINLLPVKTTLVSARDSFDIVRLHDNPMRRECALKTSQNWKPKFLLHNVLWKFHFFACPETNFWKKLIAKMKSITQRDQTLQLQIVFLSWETSVNPPCSHFKFPSPLREFVYGNPGSFDFHWFLNFFNFNLLSMRWLCRR